MVDAHARPFTRRFHFLAAQVNLTSMGHRQGKKLWLLPEEALYLADSARLLLFGMGAARGKSFCVEHYSTACVSLGAWNHSNILMSACEHGVVDANGGQPLCWARSCSKPEHAALALYVVLFSLANDCYSTRI